MANSTFDFQSTSTCTVLCEARRPDPQGTAVSSSCLKGTFLCGSQLGMASLCTTCTCAINCYPFWWTTSLVGLTVPLSWEVYFLSSLPLCVSWLTRSGVSAAILSSNRGIDRSLVATDKDVSDGKYCLLFIAPKTVVEDHRWRMLLLEHSIPLLVAIGRSTLCLQVHGKLTPIVKLCMFCRSKSFPSNTDTDGTLLIDTSSQCKACP